MEKKIFEWGLNPHSHISNVMLYHCVQVHVHAHVYVHVACTQLTHEGCEVQGSLLLPVHSLDVGTLEQKQREHIQVAVVGGVVESGLTRTITNVKVTKMRDQDLCDS